MATRSEKTVTSISSSVFYKEFTFDKNEFFVPEGSKELADTILWLDDILFAIQIKEREVSEIKGKEEEERWFNKKVLKTAVKQIGNTKEYLETHGNIEIKNVRRQKINISKQDITHMKKVIIYMQNSTLLGDKYTSMKIYESSKSGIIHLFNIDLYHWICKILITPTEVNDYLEFRENFYLKHKNKINEFSEKYLMGHFLNTSDVNNINLEYTDGSDRLKNDLEKFDISNMLNNFLEKIINKEENNTEYYPIIKEIAKLKRYELIEFKERYGKMLNDANSLTNMKPEIPFLPYRFTSTRTKCGFVFIPFEQRLSSQCQIALENFIEIYKYKRRINRCLGVICFKNGKYFDINWGYIDYEWYYNEILDEQVKMDDEIYKNPEIKIIDRYNFEN